VLCITGNGLKTTDALANRFSLEAAIEPRIASFEKFMGEAMAVSASS
jgi:threonine synthase